jgi:hypothetical protein
MYVWHLWDDHGTCQASVPCWAVRERLAGIHVLFGKNYTTFPAITQQLPWPLNLAEVFCQGRDNLSAAPSAPSASHAWKHLLLITDAC